MKKVTSCILLVLTLGLLPKHTAAQPTVTVKAGTKIVDSEQRTIYTPPIGEHVIRDKLAGLEKYIHDDEATEPLVKLALMHYQFEAIHPFHDGNGRAGRILHQ